MATPVVDESVELELEEIQGILRRGFGSLTVAKFLLLSVKPGEEARARAFVRFLVENKHVNTMHVSPRKYALQIAFSSKGLRALGVGKQTIDTFSREFIEGMDDSVRSDALGDRHLNDPSTWLWGRKGTEPDVLLMLYAPDQAHYDIHFKEILELAHAAFAIDEKPTTTLKDHREHFGWRDGLSMPKIAGIKSDPNSTRKAAQWWTKPPLAAGEFVLGYKNEYESYSESPTADLDDDPGGYLPVMPDGKRDVGKNGTYLVYREMSQNVHGMWKYLREQSNDDKDKAVALGSKMVGRWPGGTPMVVSPEREDPAHADDNKFLYRQDDYGAKCPLGAHVRRASPRDHLAEDRDVDDSIIMVRKHQMIRRGRPYGPPVDVDMDVKTIMDAPEDHVPRGLHFICLVGHISRQFEFVQRSWINSANFLALNRDGDPIAAARRPPGDPNPNNEFTCPAEPVRKKYKDMPQFTRLTGGGYFFLPSIRALKFIAQERPQ